MIVIEGDHQNIRPGSGALFLDRDGVINIDHGWVHRVEHFDWMPGIFDLARKAVRAHVPLIVVTNQGGIARGLYDEADFRKLTDWMMHAFAAQGAPLARVVACPHHPDGRLPGLSIRCDCRKPAPGMLLKCIGDLDINPGRSGLIGDNATDIEAARGADLGAAHLVGHDDSAGLLREEASGLVDRLIQAQQRY